MACSKELEKDVNPELTNVLQPRGAARNVEHYGNNAQDGIEVRISREKLLGTEYDMSHPNLGTALVINNVRFRSGTTPTLSDRRGSDIDASKIYQCLSSLGFEVDLLSNATGDQVVTKFNQVAEANHSENDCFFCVIMSHGDADGFWATDRKIYLQKLYDLINSSNCESLLGKPKVFIIQCCKGDEIDAGCVARVYEDRTVSDALPDFTEYVPPQTREDIIVVPNGMDFLTYHSTVSGKVSYRDTDSGTPFINSLCSELGILAESGAEEDIMKLFQRVNGRVAIDFQAHDGGKQMPSIESTLRKTFKLRKK